MGSESRMSNAAEYNRRVGICIPTCNAGPKWRLALSTLSSQCPETWSCLVMDSESTDGTVEIALEYGFKILNVDRRDFNHGATRQLAIEWFGECDIVVFLTQDAVIAGQHSLDYLLRAFDDADVGAVYGRQLPHVESSPIGAHARRFNYPPVSWQRTLVDRGAYGLKAAFISNSYAAYRCRTLERVGGFPANVILGEDMVVGARMLLGGWKISYSADATVYHSHDYTFMEEFRRYFDIGVLHARESWLVESFGKPMGEGLRFVISETRCLLRRAPWLLPSAMIRTVLKFAGYWFGLRESRIPVKIKSVMSMHGSYWQHQKAPGARTGRKEFETL